MCLPIERVEYHQIQEAPRSSFCNRLSDRVGRLFRSAQGSWNRGKERCGSLGERTVSFSRWMYSFFPSVPSDVKRGGELALCGASTVMGGVYGVLSVYTGAVNGDWEPLSQGVIILYIAGNCIAISIYRLKQISEETTIYQIPGIVLGTLVGTLSGTYMGYFAWGETPKEENPWKGFAAGTALTALSTLSSLPIGGVTVLLHKNLVFLLKRGICCSCCCCCKKPRKGSVELGEQVPPETMA
ncbi:MAG: hypothetical protein KGJ02_08220 [Verrucomicrobiota bacterium]|nr:hypothetical protein [Verrucomicrobiota bacterium]